MAPQENKAKWHVERTVPLAVIFGIFVQLAVFIWMGAKADSRIGEYDLRITRLEQHEATSNTLLLTIAEKLARIEGRLDYILPIQRSKDGPRSQLP